MKHILTTLFISLCTVFAGCSHNDADNLAGGETDGGRKLGENIIEFKTQRADLKYDVSFTFYCSPGVAWVDWGNGIREDGKYNYQIGTCGFIYKYTDDRQYSVKSYVSEPTSLSMNGNFTDFKMGYMPDLTHFYIYAVPNEDTYHFSRLSGTFDLGECPLLEHLQIICAKFNLRSIKISGCPNLSTIFVRESCELNAEEINALFRALPETKIIRGIDVHGNPGAATCDKSIAERKGWKVLEESRQI